MSFLVAIAGTVAHTTTKKTDGTVVNVTGWPANGASFKGSFIYTPAPTPTPVLFTKLYTDWGGFTITRQDGIGNIKLVNGGAGIQYTDGYSTGFHNVSLPVGGWQLQEYDMGFENPEFHGQTVDPEALDFNLFAVRGIFMSGNSGGPIANTVVWSVVARVDVMIVLPA